MSLINTYIHEAAHLIRTLDNSPAMRQSIYDTAWLAQIRDANGRLRWPELTGWLLDQQRPDGSWGGDLAYAHDRVICTLSTLIALKLNDTILYGCDRHRIPDAIERGLASLSFYRAKLKDELYELVGFEMIYPSLVDRASDVGLNVSPCERHIRQIRQEKLALIPDQMIYARNVTTAHSLEFLGTSAKTEKMPMAVGEVAVGNSPSATAFFVQNCPDNPTAQRYLDTAVEQSIPYLFPCETFERTWILNALSYTGVPLNRFMGSYEWEKLRSNVGQYGIGLDPTFGIPDGDISSVSLKLLTMAGYDIDLSVLENFELMNGIYRTYDYERNPSVGTNLHALEVLHLVTEGTEGLVDTASRQRIIEFLKNDFKQRGHWIDKWHISPYYIQSHLMATLIREPLFQKEIHEIVADFMSSQHEDGGWGFYGQSTAEETAYAISSLSYYYSMHASQELKEQIECGVEYLRNRDREALHPELWIGKCLYAPHRIIEATILASLIQYENFVNISTPLLVAC